MELALANEVSCHPCNPQTLLLGPRLKTLLLTSWWQRGSVSAEAIALATIPGGKHLRGHPEQQRNTFGGSNPKELLFSGRHHPSRQSHPPQLNRLHLESLLYESEVGYQSPYQEHFHPLHQPEKKSNYIREKSNYCKHTFRIMTSISEYFIPFNNTGISLTASIESKHK